MATSSALCCLASTPTADPASAFTSALCCLTLASATGTSALRCLASGTGTATATRDKRLIHFPFILRGVVLRPGGVELVLHKALRDIEGGLSVRKASFIYNLKRSTLGDACKRKVFRNAGRACELSAQEEEAVVAHLLCQSDWGFPLTRMEVSLLVKNYLDKKGVVSKRFTENLPGRKWMTAFMKRHPQLNSKVPKLIKAVRAKVDPATINRYFENLAESLEGIPPENILNFDETNLTDDPANRTVIIRRKEKYPVKVMTTSKSAISLMFAGTAAGTLLPPYVVYKSKELSETWTTDGPPATRYNRSKSGWFDMAIFEDWFRTTLFSWAESVDGDEVVIGDNVSSHFSKRVFEMCSEHKIKFICLPPNSTHLLQPLDVAFFSPLKAAWRKILGEWKKSSKNRTLTLPKPAFPALLKKLMEAIESK
ncbi:hypothetical protein FOCC_FOCC013243 [Frankliniella occidentalis]|nr:hypothetical protein FOCC_FOCC013243 [Frankliniella occidentalis]